MKRLQKRGFEVDYDELRILSRVFVAGALLCAGYSWLFWLMTK